MATVLEAAEPKQHCSPDEIIRRQGYKIYSRPRNGLPVWINSDGVLFVQRKGSILEPQKRTANI